MLIVLNVIGYLSCHISVADSFWDCHNAKYRSLLHNFLTIIYYDDATKGLIWQTLKIIRDLIKNNNTNLRNS